MKRLLIAALMWMVVVPLKATAAREHEPAAKVVAIAHHNCVLQVFLKLPSNERWRLWAHHVQALSDKGYEVQLLQTGQKPKEGLMWLQWKGDCPSWNTAARCAATASIIKNDSKGDSFLAGSSAIHDREVVLDLMLVQLPRCMIIKRWLPIK